MADLPDTLRQHAVTLSGYGMESTSARCVEAAKEIERLRVESCPPIIFLEEDRGPARYACSGCFETRTEPHTWKECHASLKERDDAVLDAFTSGSTEEELRADVKTLRQLVLDAKGYVEDAETDGVADWLRRARVAIDATKGTE